MKKVPKLLVLAFFAAWMITFTGCKKDAEITTQSTTDASVNKTPTADSVIVTTTAITSITSTTAISGGYINVDSVEPITARGVCWGIDINPTTGNNKTTDGSGTGNFASNLTGLNPGTSYFVRAYAINSTGIAYGNEVTFTTPLTENNYYLGGARYSAASFSIGTKGYVGIGYNDGDWPRRDFWEWDQATNIWTRKADFPGDITGIAVSFSIGTKGYIGTGNSVSSNGFTNEFWEYNPLTNSWTQKASLPTAPGRAFGVGFSIGNKGYIGIGMMDDGFSVSYYQDFWEWDQTTNVWTKKADFPGNAREEAVGFSIGNKGYIGTGGNGTSFTKEFWEWDQATNVWTRKADFGGIERGSAIGFSIGNKGYIGTGYKYDVNTLYLFKDIWEWDQATNLWTRKADFGGGARSSAVGVSIGSKGYIGTGNGGSTIYAYQDFWEYDPL